jgi:hypothetical protein
MTNNHRLPRLVFATALVAAFCAPLVGGSVVHAAVCAPVQTSAGTDVVLKFTNTTSCTWTVPAGVTSVRVLLIGGGGGGGHDIGGGGGGGGFREVTNAVTSPGEVVAIVAGTGGAGDTSQGVPCVGYNGTSSSIGLASGTLTAIGGGGGGGQDGGGACSTDGVAGASGGGGGVGLSWPKVGGAGTYATDGDATTFGNAGGNTPTSGGYYAGGGGGGAGGAGGNGSSNGSGSIGGAGGAGKSSDITGSTVTYAGGGAGGFFQSGTRGLGGAGGGGDGGTNGTGPTAGTDGLGGGGGGGGVQNCCYGKGGKGGDGVVIVRYSVVVATTTTSTTTTSTSTTTTTTVPATTTTAAPVLQIIINNPVTTTTIPSAATPSTALTGSVSVPVATPSSLAPTTTTVSRVRGQAGTTTTTTTTLPTATTVPVPAVAVVQTGQAAVTVGKKLQQSTVTRQDNKVVISVGKMSAVVSSVDTQGRTIALDADGNVVLEPGARVAIKIAGFAPGTEVEMWMFSTPIRIGTATVGKDGTLDTVVVIPKGLPTGAHRVAITTKAEGEDEVTFTLGVIVRKFTKESNIATWLIVVPILLAVGAALFLPPALRRRRNG